MFARILLAVGGAPYSEAAIRAAAGLGKLVPGATLLVLHVLRPLAADQHENPLYYQELVVRERARGEEFVSTVVAGLQEQQLEAAGMTVWGEPARAIVDQAREWDADIIVMGSRGLSDFKGMLVGSVSHQTIQFSHCPVLVVK